MIVDPDFFDHWRTGMVADAIGDTMAPIYIMRLWAHCQDRRSDTFVMPTRGLKAQCKFPGDAEVFESALIDAGFIIRDGDTIMTTGWAEKNASLIAAWGNGAKGGRPKKNPQITDGEPTDNPLATNDKPSENPTLTHAEPIREEKRREEKIREDIKQPLKSKAEATNGSRLPTDWTPSAEDIDFCKKTRPDLVASQVSERFKDYWIAATGKGATKRDWSATWRNWVRNEKSIPAARASPCYQTATDKAKQWADIATGKAKNESHRTIIDIN